MKHYRTFSRCLYVSALLACASIASSQAAILASDSFAYSAGTLTGQNGGTGWSAGWLQPNTNNVFYNGVTAQVNGGGSVDVALTGTASASAASRVLSSGINQTFYVSYLFTYTAAQANFGNANTFGLVLSSSSTPSGTISATDLNFGLRNSTTGGDFNNPLTSGFGNFMVRAGSAGNVSSGGQVAGGALVSGAQYQLVAQLVYSGSSTFDTINMWLNPTSPTETAANATFSLTAGTGQAVINSLSFREAANQTTDTFQFDNLVIGTTWADVVQPVPEPSVFALIGLGLGGLWLGRRKS